MKKVRNLLILLLAALMLTVFASCDNATPVPDDTEVEQPKAETKVGDLIISKVKIDSKSVIVVVSNISEQPIDITGYAIASNQGESKKTEKLPETVLNAGTSIYCYSFYDSDKQVFEVYPGMKTLPQIVRDKAYAEIKTDMLYSELDNRDFGKGTLELVKNVTKDSWETVDKVLVNEKDPKVGFIGVRKYASDTKIDQGWTVLEATDVAAFDAKPFDVDYKFSTLLPLIKDVQDEEHAPKLDTIYGRMPEAYRATFIQDAKDAGWTVTFLKADFNENAIKRVYFENTANPGVILSAETGGNWHYSNYNAAYVFDKYNTEKPTDVSMLKPYPKLLNMPEYYIPTFKADVEAKGWKLNMHDGVTDIIIDPSNTIRQTSPKYGDPKWEWLDPRIDLTLPTHTIIEDKKVAAPEGGLAITQLYLGSGDGKFIAVKNISGAELQLKDYYIANAKWDDAGKKPGKPYVKKLPDVKLAKDCTIYILYKNIDDKVTYKGDSYGKLTWAEYNGIDFSGLTELTEKSTELVSNDAYFVGFGAVTQHRYYLGIDPAAKNGQVENEAALKGVKETVDFGTPGKKYQKDHYYLRVFDETQQNSLYCKQFNSKDAETRTMIQNNFKTKAK